ncbi:MAG: tRNA (cytidine(34)-2'-O)-methyltransferase [Desulfonatronovibrionaceae bacterium]
MEVVLFCPEIPPNTGSIARLCAAAGVRLNLIEPLGFSLEDRYLKRAGLDYWPQVELKVWPGWEEFTARKKGTGRLVMTSARSGLAHHRHLYRDTDLLVFGPETKGLPPELAAGAETMLRIPILGDVRSINLANAVAVVLYEGLRQTGVLDSDPEANRDGA